MKELSVINTGFGKRKCGREGGGLVASAGNTEISLRPTRGGGMTRSLIRVHLT